MEVYESLFKVLDSDSSYIEGALEAYLKSVAHDFPIH